MVVAGRMRLLQATLHPAGEQVGEAVSKLLEYVCTTGDVLGSDLAIPVTKQQFFMLRAESVLAAATAVLQVRTAGGTVGGTVGGAMNAQSA